MDPEAVYDIRMPYYYDKQHPPATPVEAQRALAAISAPMAHSQSISKRAPNAIATLPTLDEIRRRLADIIKNVSARLPEMLQSIKDFVSYQIAALPKEVRGAIVQWDLFRAEHPYLAAAAIVAAAGLGIFAGNFILGQAALALLRMLGFSELGPVAG